MKKLKKYQSELVKWIGLIFVIIVFGLWSQWNLFSEYNINSMIETVTPLVITCLGMSFVFAHGGMDISSGAVVALAALVAVMTMNKTGSIFLGMILAMMVSMGCYIINAIVTNKFGLMSTITSLAIMFSARGIVTYICQKTPNESISISNVDVTLFKKNHIFMIVMVILSMLVFGFIFNYTRLGKGARAIGDNEISARQNGVKIDKTKMMCYLIAGICVGIASIYKLCATGMVQSTTGNGFEMDVLVVLVLGGMSLAGGMGTKISSAVIGSFTYVILIKGLTIIGMNPNLVVLVKAVVFLIIIYITAQRSNLKTIPR